MDSPIRVLHVDDEPEFLDLTASFLERESDRLVVETATTAEEGLERVAREEFDCIVSDYDIPGTDGLEFLDALREEYPDLPFILYTGKGSEAVASDAISAGVTDYLQKQPGTSQFAVLTNRITNAVEQYRSQRALEKSRKRLSLFFEQSPLGVIEWDDNFEVVRVNDTAEEILGYTEQELAGRSWEAIVPESDREAVTGVVDELLEAKGGYHSVNENVTEGGDRIICEWHNRVVTGDDGAVLAVFSQFQDVTDQKERERELEETRERMRHALDVTDSTIYEIDLDTGLEARHGPFERLFGVPSGEVPTSEAFYDRCVHPDDRERVERIQTECPGNGTDAISFEFRTHPDRDPVRWLYSEGYVHTGPDGEPRRLVGLDTEITEHKEREHSLRQLKGEYESVFDNVQDSLFLVDVIRSGDVEFELRRVNPANAELFDRSPEEIRGQTPEEVFGEQTGGEIAANYRQCLDRGEPVSYEEELQLEDGTHTFETTLTPVEVDGEVARIVGVAHDVTERKRRERDLQRQNERLDEFASVVSHDLRNPLSVAEGRLQLARGECESPHLAEVEHALDRMGALIDDLLTLAREGRPVSEPEAVALADLAGTCWRTVATAGATLEVGTDRTVRADPDRLRQLLANLFRNAVEHGSTSSDSDARGEGEGVRVTVGDLERGFYVADDGPGIPADDRSKVFQSGYSTADEGTGFGLPIVREIVEAHGWAVDLAESADGGLRVEITGVECPE